MIRPFIRFTGAVALVALSMSLTQAFAQTEVPPAPAAPAPAAAPVFPKPDPANFTAASPTKETVSAFLTANWGPWFSTTTIAATVLVLCLPADVDT